MLTLTANQYNVMVADAQVIEQDAYGVKVLGLADGTFLKLFRRKRLISSAAWYPYAERFADNAEVLAKRRVLCPSVTAVYRIPSIKRDAVHYHPLEGKTLRQLFRSGEAPASLHGRLFSFIDRLHQAGIYFRSLHLGNIVLTPEGELGLIDIADLRVWPFALRGFQRRRNLRHLYRDPQDRAWLNVPGAG